MISGERSLRFAYGGEQRAQEVRQSGTLERAGGSDSVTASVHQDRPGKRKSMASFTPRLYRRNRGWPFRCTAPAPPVRLLRVLFIAGAAGLQKWLSLLIVVDR